MAVEHFIESTAGTPYTITEQTSTEKLRFLDTRSEEIFHRFSIAKPEIRVLLRTDPEFRAFQTFHSNKLELQGPDLSRTEELIGQFSADADPDNLRDFSVMYAVRGDRHLIEVLGQHQANLLVERIATGLTDDQQLREVDVRSLNEFLIQDKFFAGKYRETDSVNIGQYFDDDDPMWWSRSLDHPVEVTWHQIPSHMHDICRFISRRQSNPILASAIAHAWFTHVHPFHDGNGRTARLITNLVLIRNGWPPLTVEKQMRDEYIDALKESDYGGNIIPLFDLFVRCMDLGLSQLESVDFWTHRYRLELTSKESERHRAWEEIARSFVRMLRENLFEHGWVLERLNMPDIPTFTLLERGEVRAATQFARLRHPDGRGIRIGLGYMSAAMKSARDFDASLDNIHFPPTIYFQEADFSDGAAFPFVHRNASEFPVREITFLPLERVRKAGVLYGRDSREGINLTIEDLARLVCDDVLNLQFNVRSPGESPHLLPTELRDAVELLTEKVRDLPRNWDVLIEQFVALVESGQILAKDFEANGILMSKIGIITKKCASSFSDFQVPPPKLVDVLLRVLSRLTDPSVILVQTKDHHPVLVEKRRAFGRPPFGQYRN